MKKKLAMLFVLIMILSCMPVMADTIPAGAAAADKAVSVSAVKNGWQKSGSNWRYYVKGAYKKNCVFQISKTYYAFDANGYLQKGWTTIKRKTYYGSTQFGPKGYGILVTGHVKIGNDYYYLKPALQKGFVKIGKKLYYFSSDTGKQQRSKGWFTVSNKMYYVQADGSIATNTTIDGYKVGSTGAVSDVTGMDKKAQGYSSSTRYLILVIKKQHLINIYKGSKGKWVAVRRNIPCTIGKSSTPSPSGKFTLNHKSSRAYGYKDFNGSTVFYATRISAGNYFHSILYRKGSRNPATAKVKDGSLGKSKSNSCIRMPLQDAKYIHQVTPTGSRVVVY